MPTVEMGTTGIYFPPIFGGAPGAGLPAVRFISLFCCVSPLCGCAWLKEEAYHRSKRPEALAQLEPIASASVLLANLTWFWLWSVCQKNTSCVGSVLDFLANTTDRFGGCVWLLGLVPTSEVRHIHKRQFSLC